MYILTVVHDALIVVRHPMLSLSFSLNTAWCTALCTADGRLVYSL